MSNSIVSAFKRTAAACTLFGVALACLLGPMPAAANGLPSLARGTHSNSFVRERAEEAFINPASGIPLNRYWCPESHPWLLNVPLSPGRIVPNGIEVLEPGGIGVSIYTYHRDHNGFVTGYEDGSASNWAPTRQQLRIYAYCTNNRNDGYRA
jgi:hypothetical protein